MSAARQDESEATSHRREQESSLQDNGLEFRKPRIADYSRTFHPIDNCVKHVE